MVCNSPLVSTAQSSDRPRRDSAATKRRLLAAATAEFAAHGIAGARVDRIAATARANKRQIYDYFDDKDGLFDAVLEAHSGAIIEATHPIDPDDIVAYAGRLFDYHLEHPELVRLVQWARLEGRVTPASYDKRIGSFRRRTAAIEEAQQRGRINSRLTPEQVLTLIESISVGWTITTTEFLADADRESRDRPAQRRLITDSVQRLLA
jgi:AcrR family transcriptional regulator